MIADSQKNKAPRDTQPLRVVFWCGAIMVISGFISLWVGSTIAAPILVVFGYVTLGLGILQ